jgi:hypothetical protein
MLRLGSPPLTTTTVETRAVGDSRTRVAIVRFRQQKMASLLVKSRKLMRILKK